MALREIDLATAMARFRGKSVAVVGNSADLLKQHWGNKIDKRDIVIRMNRGMPGYHRAPSEATGRKTTILGCGVISPFDEVFRYGVPDELWWFKHTFSGAIHLSEVSKCQRLQQCRLLWWPAVLEGKIQDEIGHAPSSGLRIAHLLRHHAEPRTIDFYGFGFWGLASGSKINWHSGGAAHSAHDPWAELAYFKKLGYQHQGEGRWTDKR